VCASKRFFYTPNQFKKQAPADGCVRRALYSLAKGEFRQGVLYDALIKAWHCERASSFFAGDAFLNCTNFQLLPPVFSQDLYAGLTARARGDATTGSETLEPFTATGAGADFAMSFIKRLNIEVRFVGN